MFWFGKVITVYQFVFSFLDTFATKFHWIKYEFCKIVHNLACFDSTTAVELMKCSLGQSNKVVWFEIDGKGGLDGGHAEARRPSPPWRWNTYTALIYDEARLDGSWKIESLAEVMVARTKVGWVRRLPGQEGAEGSIWQLARHLFNPDTSTPLLSILL